MKGDWMTILILIYALILVGICLYTLITHRPISIWIYIVLNIVLLIAFIGLLWGMFYPSIYIVPIEGDFVVADNINV